MENVEPMGFKAFLVAVDRAACAAYKEELDRHLPPEYSQVVYSSAHNDGMEMKRYYLSDDQEKKVRQDFTKKDSLPKILIVTQKLLTGFDAPILYCMYLDNLSCRPPDPELPAHGDAEGHWRVRDSARDGPHACAKPRAGLQELP